MDINSEIIINRKIQTKILSFNNKIPKLFIQKKVLIITDSNLLKIYENHLKKLFKDSSVLLILSFPAGEENKNFLQMDKLLNLFFENKIDKTWKIVGFGGGVTLDLAGFIASVYYRGLKFYSIPTSMLAIIDASIGGKTGINNSYGKNLLGNYYFPEKIFVDFNYLKTLPENEWINGFGELLKYGVIGDEKLFSELEEYLNTTNIDDVFSEKAVNSEKLIEMMKKAVNLKVRVINRDPFEKDLRNILNFGHTIAHGIELYSKYKIPHGKAVLLGILVESKLANRFGKLCKNHLDRIINFILKFKFDLGSTFSFLEIMNYLKFDKKNRGENIMFLFPETIGKMDKNNENYLFTLNEKQIMEILQDVENLFNRV
jgi:3-dehydroquinate synthase